jgi:membrane-bound acyltransferase YfiQ involved in biofilm formation
MGKWKILFIVFVLIVLVAQAYMFYDLTNIAIEDDNYVHLPIFAALIITTWVQMYFFHKYWFTHDGTAEG